MNLTMKDRIIISRALGLIEAAASLVDGKAAEKLDEALAMLEGVLRV